MQKKIKLQLGIVASQWLIVEGKTVCRICDVLGSGRNSCIKSATADLKTRGMKGVGGSEEAFARRGGGPGERSSV